MMSENVFGNLLAIANPESRIPVLIPGKIFRFYSEGCTVKPTKHWVIHAQGITGNRIRTTIIINDGYFRIRDYISGLSDYFTCTSFCFKPG